MTTRLQPWKDIGSLVLPPSYIADLKASESEGDKRYLRELDPLLRGEEVPAHPLNGPVDMTRCRGFVYRHQDIVRTVCTRRPVQGRVKERFWKEELVPGEDRIRIYELYYVAPVSGVAPEKEGLWLQDKGRYYGLSQVQLLEAASPTESEPSVEFVLDFPDRVRVPMWEANRQADPYGHRIIGRVWRDGVEGIGESYVLSGLDDYESVDIAFLAVMCSERCNRTRLVGSSDPVERPTEDPEE